MAKARVDDAHLLLEFERLKFTDTLEEAFAWYSKEVAHSPKMSHKEFMEKFPEGSDAQRYVERIGQFYETMGTLARHGLIDLDLLFDRYGVFPFWERLSFDIEQERKDDQTMGAALGENFEWLAKKNEAWLRKRLKKMKGKKKEEEKDK